MGVLNDIVVKLRSDAPSFEVRVSIAQNINNPFPTALPEAWVHRWIENAESSSTTNFTVQRMFCEVGVLVACAHESEVDDSVLERIKREILGALIDRNFLVGNDRAPLEMSRLEFMEPADEYQLFRITFRYEEYVRG